MKCPHCTTGYGRRWNIRTAKFTHYTAELGIHKVAVKYQNYICKNSRCARSTRKMILKDSPSSVSDLYPHARMTIEAVVYIKCLNSELDKFDIKKKERIKLLEKTLGIRSDHLSLALDFVITK